MAKSAEFKAREVFEAATEAATQERELVITRMCRQDAALEQRVRALLSADAGATTFFDGHARAAATASIHASDLTGLVIGRYKLGRLLGAGAMGSVYAAEQESPRREVALKVSAAPFLDSGMMRRFEFESEALGRLRHPGIAQVFESGVHELAADAVQLRVPYFAMELVAGGLPITSYCTRNVLTIRDRVTLVASVCDAVHHAHLHGVVHRDLKPANILVDSSAHARVIDFGVARLLDLGDAASVTIAGHAVGTPAYMAPEQCSGHSHVIDARTDVYALGVVLFELLAGRRPHEGTSAPEVMREIQESMPPSLSQIVPNLDQDLNTIVRTAMAKEKESRYSSAAALAEDLQRWLAHLPITARPATLSYQVRKLARRHRVAAVAVVAALCMLVAAVAGTSWSLARARSEARTSRQAALLLEDLLASSSPASLGSNVTMRQVAEEAERRLTEDSRLTLPMQAAMHGAIGKIRLGHLDFAGAEPHVRRAWELRRVLSGEAGEDTLNTAADLGYLLAKLGRSGESENVLRGALRSARAAEPAARRTLLLTLGTILQDAGRAAEAEQAYSDCLSEHTKDNELDAETRRNVLANRALLLNQLGKAPEAESQARALIPEIEAAEGADSLSALVARRALAESLAAQKRHLDSAHEFAQVAEAYAHAVGPDAADTIILTRSHARELGNAGDHAGAMVILRDLLPRAEAALGATNPIVAELASDVSRESAAILPQDRHK